TPGHAPSSLLAPRLKSERRLPENRRARPTLRPPLCRRPSEALPKRTPTVRRTPEQKGPLRCRPPEAGPEQWATEQQPPPRTLGCSSVQSNSATERLPRSTPERSF